MTDAVGQRPIIRQPLLRRMNRKGGQEAVEIVAVFVQLALLPRYGEFTFVCPKQLEKNEEPAASSSRYLSCHRYFTALETRSCKGSAS